MPESPKSLVPKFFSKTATTYDKIVTTTTFGKDKFWKNKIIKQIDQGDSFLDLACGTGILTRMIADKFPNSQIIGVDISECYLQVAKKNSRQYKNITYVHQDAEQLNVDSKFDCIVSSYIPKYCDADTLIKACIKHLKPQGKIILHDFIYPTNKMTRNLWNFYFVLLRCVGFFVPSWHDAFAELPALIRTSRWQTDYTKAMKNQGFDVKEVFLTWNTSFLLIGKMS